MDKALESKFEGAMFDIYRRAKSEAKYNANAFLGMLNDRGGLYTAKALINAPRQSDGYTALLMAGRLDLTVEALVVEDIRWKPLFLHEEIEKAKKRLAANQYVPRPRN
ncbi:hypothetical protein [Neoaquamicrobium sediminum]|uniref:Uncharacterized protein n=1 Tax=Neoaquamicrobium sediminum TaxID=1849104 RepID=A0ABV3WXP0_9HYPH